MKYPVNYNKEAIRSLVRRAMRKGFYEGVNLSLSYGDDCGHEELSMDVCPIILLVLHFQEDKKDNTLHWKGSSNQLVIDVKNTLKIGEIVLHG